MPYPFSCKSWVWLSLAVTLALPVRLAFAQDVGSWQSYTSADGLGESWVYRVSIGTRDRVWLSHGIDRLTMFDGYRFRHLPSPGRNLTVRETPAGALWAFAWDPDRVEVPAGVQRLRSSAWERFPIAGLDADGPDPHNFLTRGEDTVIFTTERGIEAFDASTSTRTRVLDAEEVGLGALAGLLVLQDHVWLMGEYGAARSRGRADNFDPHAGWDVVPLPGGLSRLQNLSLSADGVLMADALDVARQRRVLLWRRNGPWAVVGTSRAETEGIRGWAAGAGAWWVARSVQDTFQLSLADARGETATLLPSRVLTGRLLDVQPTRGDVHWVATSLGVARGSAASWQVPRELAGIESPASAVYETNGLLYVAFREALAVRDEDRWRIVPLPGGARTPIVPDGGLGGLADGRIAINTDIEGALLTFDPRTDRFVRAERPGAQRVSLLGRRDERSVWVMTQMGSSFAIERFDGTRFETVLQRDSWSVVGLRQAIEVDGLLWLAGADGDGLARVAITGDGAADAGTYESFDRSVYPGLGAFSALHAGGGRLWLGDRNQIIEFDGTTSRVVHRNTETVRSMIRARDGSVWVAAGSGVHHFTEGTWLSMGVDQGLSAGALDVFQDSRGQIWVGTMRGVRVFDPSADLDPPETEVPVDLNLAETPPDGQVRVVFSGTDKWFRTPVNRLFYSHRLDEGPWSPFEAGTVAAFSGVTAGVHTFRVRAMDQQGNVDPTPASFAFRVLLPWYAQAGTRWLILAVGVLVIALLVLHVWRHLRLEHLVRARTSDLVAANEQLRAEFAEREKGEQERRALGEQLQQAQKMEAVGRLAGGVAHDFNNLLTVVNGYSELALASLPSEHPLAESLHEIVKAGESAAALTRQLLAFSRRQVLETRVLDLNQVVTQLGRMIRRLIGEDIVLVVEAHADPGFVRADPGHIEQVLLNLVVNARDAMPDGGTLTIETQNVDLDDSYAAHHVQVQTGLYVMLAVTDTGVGMTAEVKARIFEPFFTTKVAGKGTGLGLSMVYGIVKQMNGNIWVYSEPDHGTTFKVYLPLVAETSIERGKSMGELAPVGAETVLVLEDEPAVRRLACTILERGGYRVLVATGAREALALSDRYGGVIDLLLTDVVMPDMNGRAVAEQLRARRPELRVVFMSGYTDDAILRLGVLAAGVPFIQKPFTPQALLQRVRAALDA